MGVLDWNALQFILALARHQSLERAAMELEVDPSTVSRRVHGLERDIGARVFDRTGAGHRLTAVGQRLLEAAERVEADIAAMEREADRADQRLQGLVRIATSDAFGRHRLAPILCRFRQEHPLVDFELVADTRSASLVRREADLAVRFVRPSQAQLASRRVAALGHGLYAARAYLARRPFDRGAPTRGHDLVGYHSSLASLPEARWLDQRAQGARFALRANRVDLLLPAAAAGLGLAVLPCYLADAEPDLVRLLGPREVVTRELWLVVHRDSRRISRIRAFVDHFTAEIQAQATSLLGEEPAADRAGPGSAP
ncbi:MAG TPA: LysR family transcriptional regulator [Anaeromyxobacteraceae bacterium]|nr:LysR family transcriptional regulator [Anaeromyxobacteraceae bacterium]